jgi:serine/threonine-protein kinase
MLGQYHVLEELGRNALGPLHLARLEGPKGFQRWAVIRIVSPEMARRTSIDLYARARTGAQLIHPNVAALFEIGEQDDGSIWVASEYVHGAPVSEILERASMARTPVPWEVAAQITLDAAEGLHATSDRSLKSKIVPGTLAPWRMLAMFDGKTKLVGVFEPRGTKEPLRMSYTAPEDLFGETVSASADVFTLGIIFWELCAGRRLFHGSTDEETAAMIEAHRVARIGTQIRGFPRAIDEVIRKALASRPDARYANPRELSRAISSAYVAERRVVGAEDVGKYVRSLCGDIAGEMEDRLARASDVTEVYRRGGRGTMPSMDLPTPPLGKGAVDPSAFDDDLQTEEMRTAKLIPELSPDDTLTEERPIPGRDVLPSTADTPSLGADTVRDLAEASAPTPHRGSPSSSRPPPPLAPPTRTAPRSLVVRTPGVLPPMRAPTPSRPPPPVASPPPAKKARPRPPGDSFEHIGGDSEVFFARSEDGDRLVRKPPARTPVVTPSDSVVIEPEALKPEPYLAPTPAAGIPSSQPPPSMGAPPMAHIPAPPSPFAHHAVPSPPGRPPMTSTVERAGRGFVFAALGATIGVAAFLLIVSIAPGPRPPPTVVTATTTPTATQTLTARTTVAPPTTTTTTPIATHAPIPTMNVSSLPAAHTGNRPHVTHAPPPPPPPPAAGKGFLTVMCTPACDDVLVDGRSLGSSPVFKAPVSTGTHRLLLRGDVEKTMDVTITADETTLVKPPMK